MENVNIENNAEMPITPTWFTQNGEKSHRPLKQGEKTGYEYLSTGLSKREYFAVLAMQATDLEAYADKYGNKWADEAAKDSVQMADALLRALAEK